MTGCYGMRMGGRGVATTIPSSSTVAEIVASPRRLESLDVFRGATIAMHARRRPFTIFTTGG